MKVIKIILIAALVLIVVLSVAVVIFVKTFDVDRYKPQIIAGAQTALNREFDFDTARLDISFRQGINAKISNLVIGENPRFRQGDFVRVKEISVSIDVLAYLLQKKINIPSVYIDSPRITIIREKDGRINAASFEASAAAGAAAQNPATSPAPFVLPAVLVSSLTVDNAAVTYIDRSSEPALSLDATDIHVAVRQISLTDPFPFLVEAAVLAPKKNIKIEGVVKLDMAKNTVIVSDLKAGTDLAAIVLAKIPVVFPTAKGVMLPETLKGNVDVRLDSLSAGQQGLGPLRAAIAVSGGAVRFKELVPPVQDAEAKITLSQTDVVMDAVSCGIGGGTIQASGSLKDYALTQGYHMAADIRNVKLQDALVQDKAAVKLEGAVSGPLEVSGTGFSPEAIRSNMSAKADIRVSNAKLVDLNVLRIVLDKISVVPGLSQSIEASLSPELQNRLAQRDTKLSDITLPVTVENGRIVVTDAVIASDDFSFKGRVEAGFDATYSLEGTFLIAQDFSSAMVSGVSQLQYLCNENKQIYIPLKVSGNASKVAFIVDADYIGKKLLENQAKQQIFKALDKSLGTSEQDGGGSSAVKDAVGSIIGNIFKK